MEKLHKSNWHRESLHSHNYQHCLKLLDQNWKSYFKSIADFKKNPSKYNGMPMPPKYKNINNKKNEVIFTAVGIRFNFTKDYLHKASKQLVDYAVKHHCKTIVIGDISNIKQGNNIKNFVQSPVQKFSTMVAYKAALKGIEVVFQKEAYTSGCSALDLEPITLASYNKKRRIHRGLFQSSYGFINADVNGSLNILRLYTKDTCIPKLIVSVRGKGYVNNPVKQRVA